jgi:hypothetical protein
MLAKTLPGIPFCFAGGGIGMPSVDVSERDPDDAFEKLAPCYGLNRDPALDIRSAWGETCRNCPTTGIRCCGCTAASSARAPSRAAGVFRSEASERAICGEVVMVALNLSEEPRRLVGGRGKAPDLDAS